MHTYIHTQARCQYCCPLHVICGGGYMSYEEEDTCHTRCQYCCPLLPHCHNRGTRVSQKKKQCTEKKLHYS